MTGASAALELAAWAAALRPTPDDLALARRSLLDTAAVALAAVADPLVRLAGPALGSGGRLAVAAHLLDYDDLHLPSTSHVSAVCVPAALAAGGDARREGRAAAGRPGRPPSEADLGEKIAACAGPDADADAVAALDWDTAAREPPALLAGRAPA